MDDSSKYPDFACNRTVALVGMMGAGKSTIGRRLAPRLGLPFYDADTEIEEAAGMSVSELFQRHGEKSFREGEARVIARLISGPPHVLATGGGALTHPETRDLLKEKAITVWLKADLDVLAQRATKRNTRPLLQNGNPQETLKKLMEEREAFYAQADIQIESQTGPHEQTVTLIVQSIAAQLNIQLDDSKSS